MSNSNDPRIRLAITVSLLVLGTLIPVQIFVPRTMLLAERFVEHLGWVEIFFLSLYAGFLAYKMQNIAEQARYRLISWGIFSFAFFSQLILGILGVEKCLMTGTLHLPVPAMIIAGPLFRNEISFMPLLFLSTIILSGPAWCSQFCYFGALDGILSNKGKASAGQKIWAFRWMMLSITVATSVTLNILGAQLLTAALFGSAFGVFGLCVALLFSRKKGIMTHCIYYCPVGSMVSLLKWINPIRIKIDADCTKCLQCISVCRYSAIDIHALDSGKPKLQCTNCGDCLNSCHGAFIHYSLFSLNPESARKIYLGITITIHVIFLGLARI